MPPALPPLLPDDGDPLATQDLSQTAQALPFSDSVTGGQPTQIPDVPDRPERPDLPRVDPEEEFPGGRPQRDQGARNRQALTGLLSAVGAALAPQDSPVAFNVASGLSQGAAQLARTSEEEFRQRQQAFREFVTDAQRFNRQAKQAEAEQEFESRLADFEGRMDQRKQVIEGELERRRAARERQFERQQNQREHQRTLEQIRARGQQRRKSAALRNDLDSEDGTDTTAGDVSKGDASKAPAGYEPKKVRTEEGFKVWEMQDGEVVGEHGGLTEDQADRLLRQLRERGRPLGPMGPDMLDSQTRTGTSSTDSTRTDSTTAPPDSTAPADTTAPDTTTTRGLGRTPSHVAPQELGMKTSGGNPGGGLSKPSSGGTRLRNMGGQPRSIEKLMSEAESLVAELGPQVVRRRLTQLVERGRVDRQTAQTVRRHAQQIHRYARIAVERSPKAALDTLEADLIRGDVTDGEARRLADRLEERYAR